MSDTATGPTPRTTPVDVSTESGTILLDETTTITVTSTPSSAGAGPQNSQLAGPSTTVSNSTEGAATQYAATVFTTVPASSSPTVSSQSSESTKSSQNTEAVQTESKPTLTATSTPVAGTPASSSAGGSSSSGLSTGAKAGIAVGAVAIVAIIAGFFIWKFCVGKRRNRERTAAYGQARVGAPGTSNPSSVEKGAPLVGAVAPVYRDSPPPENQNLLPQQADDATVQSRFSTLYDQIELHAENFYKDASPMIPPSIEGSLSRYDTPILGAPLAARLEESPRTTTILKHVLSYEITTTVVDPTSADRRRSLLPTPLLALLQEVQSQQSTPQAGRRGHQTSAYSRLKQLAASYRSSPQSMPTSTSSATREAASHFTQVFSLWADPQYDETRRTQHLTEVLDSAIKFSVWLLSQPETFELRWDGSSSGATNASSSSTNDKETSSLGDHSLVTVPALVKVTSNGGNQRLSRNSEKVLCKIVKRPI